MVDGSCDFESEVVGLCVEPDQNVWSYAVLHANDCHVEPHLCVSLYAEQRQCGFVGGNVVRR